MTPLSPSPLIRYFPGTEYLPLPPQPDILSDSPIWFRLGYDASRNDVRTAVVKTMALLRAGVPARLMLPHYAARFVPANHRRFSLGPQPRKLVDCLALIDRTVSPPYLTELNRACRDARGNYYPGLWLRAVELIEQGEALLPALAGAYAAWAPGLLAPLAELATDHTSMLSGRQLVRDWHRHGKLERRTDYFRTGREMLPFMESFGVVAREGAGRLRWGPLYANVFSYLTHSRLL